MIKGIDEPELAIVMLTIITMALIVRGEGIEIIMTLVAIIAGLAGFDVGWHLPQKGSENK